MNDERGYGPKIYILHLGIGPRSLWEYACQYDELIVKDEKSVHFGDCEEFTHLLPRDLNQLHISENKQWTRCLCDALSFNGPSSLRDIEIIHCIKLESLFCLSGLCSLCTNLQDLTSLNLQFLDSLDVICQENDEGMTQVLPPCNKFSYLNHLEIWQCHKMEKLLTAVSLQQLLNLSSIKVCTCDSMKEIFSMRSSDDDNDHSTFTLLKSMRLC